MRKRFVIISGFACLLFVVGFLAYHGAGLHKSEVAIPVVTGSVLSVAGGSGWPEYTSPTPIPSVDVQRIFSRDHSWAARLPPSKTVTMIATGDVLPARSVNYKMVTGNGFLWPFEKTKDVLAAADVTVVNLETPLLSNCQPTQTGMSFCGDARAAEGLVYAGVDVATLGNNHTGNHALAGIKETVSILRKAGIEPIGIGPVYKEFKGFRFAFLSYNDIGAREPGVPWADDGTVEKEIREARKNADIVIVAPHWGVEYVTQPSPRQRELARLMIDAGADVIIGNHPHWIQPVEFYKGKFIIYAHGNFVFDQEWSEETKVGIVGRYTFFEGNLVDVEYMPVRIVGYGQPYFLEGSQKNDLLKTMESASKALSGH